MPKDTLKRQKSGNNAAKRNLSQSLVYKNYKLIILGDGSVGKTALVTRFSVGRFKKPSEQTLVASYSSLNLNQYTRFNVWELAGEERWHNLAHMYYEGAQAALVIYDVRNRDSLESAKNWIKELPKDMVIAIAGNKVDLWDRRCIDSEEVKSYAEEQGYLFMETSAKTGHNVRAIFDLIADKITAKPIMEDESIAEPRHLRVCAIL